MGTSATLSVRTGTHFTNVYVNFDGMPEHMLTALRNVTDEEILAAREIRGIDADGAIEAYHDPIAPSVTLAPDTGLASYTYVRRDGEWEVL